MIYASASSQRLRSAAFKHWLCTALVLASCASTLGTGQVMGPRSFAEKSEQLDSDGKWQPFYWANGESAVCQAVQQRSMLANQFTSQEHGDRAGDNGDRESTQAAISNVETESATETGGSHYGQVRFDDDSSDVDYEKRNSAGLQERNGGCRCLVNQNARTETSERSGLRRPSRNANKYHYLALGRRKRESVDPHESEQLQVKQNVVTPAMAAQVHEVDYYDYDDYNDSEKRNADKKRKVYRSNKHRNYYIPNVYYQSVVGGALGKRGFPKKMRQTTLLRLG